MMFAVSRHVMKRAMQLMNRQLMAVESYNRVVSPGRPTVVLLSGGVDSTTELARRDECEVYALTFHYRQRHAAEIDAARRVAAAFGGARHEILTIDLRAFGGSALTSDLPVPKDRATADMGADIPVTYVPARNTIFLSFALAFAEVVGSRDIT